MSDDERAIELEIEVAATPEQAWQAIATGPGISSWYVPHTVDERVGGNAVASFGSAPEMQIEVSITSWEPPNRVVFGGSGGIEELVFEWLVEPQDDGTCIVRLVNSGFGSGAEWDDQFDGMSDGWPLFLFNLKLHLEHFAGQSATTMLPMGSWAGPRDKALVTLLDALGIDPAPEVGDQIAVTAPAAPALSGRVVSVSSWQVTLLLDGPALGTAFIAAEGKGEQVGASVWAYLYGADAAAIAERDSALWQQWFSDRVDP